MVEYDLLSNDYIFYFIFFQMVYLIAECWELSDCSLSAIAAPVGGESD